MIEQKYEKILNIRTEGFQFGYPKDAMYHRYEPTPYNALEQLFEHYALPERAHIVDFGCGKGRVPIYLHWKFKLPTVGVEMDQKFFVEAEQNLHTYSEGLKKRFVPITFEHQIAERYSIKHQENVFFFFNPFSVHIFRQVVANILASYEQHIRCIDIVLYYPSPDYLYYLAYETPFENVMDVKLEGYNNENERFCIYRLHG
jgi:SAM-dependent methyltransferase